MPGRKSNVSTTPSNAPEPVVETTPSAPNKQTKEKEGLSVDDLSLPKSMIARLAKGVLPANTQIHKDALLSLHKSATVFVSYIASNADDNAQAGGKKTIAPQDVFAALKDVELDGFLPRLEAELKKYNETQCDKRNTYRRKVKEEKAAAAAKDSAEGDVSVPSKEGEPAADGGARDGAAVRTGDDDDDDGGGDDDDGAGRPAKRLKAANGSAAALPGTVGGADDDEPDDDHEPDDNEDDADEDGAEDDVPDEESEDDDQTMEDALEERPHRSEMRDEALDDPDSD